MLRFNSDYLEGAHENIIKRLIETNLTQTAAYGNDEISISAKEKIKKAIDCPGARVFFVLGGTQANYLTLDSILERYEGVLCTDTAHINVHEAGAIEYSGHKVIALKGKDAKLGFDDAKAYLESFYADCTNEHMVRPGAMYISHPTEYGTLYTKDELKALRSLCDKYDMKLYCDGARLGYALASPKTDVTLPDLAAYCHAFYIGGTKVGAMFGEAIVFTDEKLSPRFFTEMKQHGAMLAKGRMLGIQFDELFTDDLYIKISKHAIDLAMKIKAEMKKKGYEEYMDSYTNQQFFIIPNKKLDEVKDELFFDDWGPFGDDCRITRITTSWATTEKMLEKLFELM